MLHDILMYIRGLYNIMTYQELPNYDLPDYELQIIFNFL